MKKISIFILGLFYSLTAMAQHWDNVVVVAGTVGAIVSSEYALYQALVKRELKGWATKDTGTSVKLENQCGIQTEFHLIGDYKRNYIMMGIANESGKQVAMNFRRVKFIINGKNERYPGYSYQVTDELVNNGWWILAQIPLPKKDEFATYDKLRLEVPVVRTGETKPCMIVTEFTRTGHFPKEEVSYNFFEFMFDFGPALTQTGKAKELGDSDIIWGMDFNWYFSANHGAGMAFQWEYGFDDADRATNNNANVFSGDLHYVYRRYLNPKLTFNFEPGVGYQGLYSDYGCRYCDREHSSTFMMDYRLMLQYIFTSWTIAEMDVMNFFVGGGMVHQYGFSGQTEGSRIGLLIRLGMGF